MTDVEAIRTRVLGVAEFVDHCADESHSLAAEAYRDIARRIRAAVEDETAGIDMPPSMIRSVAQK